MDLTPDNGNFHRPPWKPGLPDARSNRLAWFTAIGVFLLFIALVVAAAIHRLGNRLHADSSPAFPVAGSMPPGFDTDDSPEASAFRLTCQQCHVLPSPSIHDEAGWRQVRQKMTAQMAARGVEIPRRQVELAIAYAIRYGKRGRPDVATRPG